MHIKTFSDILFTTFGRFFMSNKVSLKESSVTKHVAMKYFFKKKFLKRYFLSILKDELNEPFKEIPLIKNGKTLNIKILVLQISDTTW